MNSFFSQPKRGRISAFLTATLIAIMSAMSLYPEGARELAIGGILLALLLWALTMYVTRRRTDQIATLERIICARFHDIDRPTRARVPAHVLRFWSNPPFQ